MPAPTISTLPDAPSISDPANFSSEASAFVAALATLQGELNSYGTYLNTLELELQNIIDTIKDSNENEVLDFQGVASAVNFLQLFNAATGGNAILQAAGDDANVGIELRVKGSGEILSDALTVEGAATVEGILNVGANGGGDALVEFYDDTNDARRSFGWDDSAGGFAAEDSAGGLNPVVHEGNLKELSAAIGKEGVSSYLLVEVVDAGALPATDGTTLFAYQIEWSATTGNSAGNPTSGSYRVHGRANAANPYTLVKRLD